MVLQQKWQDGELLSVRLGLPALRSCFADAVMLVAPFTEHWNCYGSRSVSDQGF
jgi:hypothetical protein